MLATRGEGLKGKTVLVSGSGNVAQYATEKAMQLGAKVITLSDSNGFIVDRNGIDAEKLAYLLELKNVRRGRISEYAKKFKGAEYHEGRGVWHVGGEVALPCATQNEVDAGDAKTLVAKGVQCVSEGANMPTLPDAVEIFQSSKILFGPGKAANAGGVAVSGLEMAQNSQRMRWSREEVDAKLHDIMRNIHRQCVETAERYDTPGNYVNGANIAGFLKVAHAMLDQGLI
jgi:glutamate dehydrogenase (NADP+)